MQKTSSEFGVRSSELKGRKKFGVQTAEDNTKDKDGGVAASVEEKGSKSPELRTLPAFQRRTVFTTPNSELRTPNCLYNSELRTPN